MIHACVLLVLLLLEAGGLRRGMLQCGRQLPSFAGREREGSGVRAADNESYMTDHGLLIFQRRKGPLPLLLHGGTIPYESHGSWTVGPPPVRSPAAAAARVLVVLITILLSLVSIC